MRKAPNRPLSRARIGLAAKLFFFYPFATTPRYIPGSATSCHQVVTTPEPPLMNEGEAMPTEHRPPDSPPRGRSLIGELQSLLSSLLGLYSQLSSRMLHKRMSTQQRATTPREGLPIGDLLDQHIEQTTAAAPGPSGDAASEEATTESPQASENSSIAAAGKTDPTHSSSGFFSALSSYFGRHRRSAHSEPLLREKMRTNTLEHINRARVLARRGDAKGAKVHATLAESAMQTAGGYMSDEEYLQFKEEVEARVQTLSRPAG